VHTDTLLEGFRKYIIGSFKYAVIGKTLAGLYRELAGYGPGEATALSAWMELFCFALALYFLLSGLSGMARGTALLLGYSLPQNFYYPYQSRSVEDFSQRFLSTVWRFGKSLFPVGENTPPSSVVAVLQLILTGLFFGLWFGMRANTLLWGAYIALVIALERLVYPKLFGALPTLFCRFYALGAVVLGFVALSEDSLGASAAAIKDLFGFIGDRLPWYNDGVMYLLSSNWFLIAVSCIAATNLLDVVARWLRVTVPKTERYGGAAVSVVMLVLYVALSI
jgi:alginate O-acetyltransferase complex protein AlgI